MAEPNLEIKAVSNIGQRGWLFWGKKKKKAPKISPLPVQSLF